MACLFKILNINFPKKSHLKPEKRLVFLCFQEKSTSLEMDQSLYFFGNQRRKMWN